MARILLAWEYGGARGHVSQLRLVAESLGPDHSYDAALSRLDHADELQPFCEQVFRGPRLSVLRKSRPSVPHTGSFFDTLVSCGFLDSRGITRNIGWWRELMQQRRIDLLVADSAPRALLAARSLGVPCVVIGSGYFVPPPTMPAFPPLFGSGTVAGPHLSEMTEAINAAIVPHGLEPITQLPELYRADDQIICTLPQLDPYPEYRDRALVPPLRYQPEGKLPPGEEVFIYLSSGERNNPAITDALKRLGVPAVLVCPGLGDTKVAEFRAAGLAVETQPLSPAEIRRRSRLMVHSANHGTLCLGIAMGLPQVALPQHTEQHYQAVRADQLGVLKHLDKPQQTAEAIETLTHEALADGALAQRARDVAAEVRGFVTQDVESLLRERLSPFLSKEPRRFSSEAVAVEPLPAPPPIASRSELQQQYFEMLMGSQFWSAQQLLDYQRQQLEPLLLHARANVPFYQNRLDALFTRDGTIEWDRWRELPILMRSDLAAHHEAMQALVLPPGHGPSGVVETSGSSGLPIRVSVSRLAKLASDAVCWRTQKNYGLSWSREMLQRLGNDPDADAWPEGRAVPGWGPPPKLSEERGSAWLLNRFTRPEQMLEFLSRKQIPYLSAASKVAHVMALESRRLDIPVSLDAILAYGERVGDDDRAICAEVFGARIIEHYSSIESGHIAHRCAAGSLHINAENVLVEILDRNGQPCAPGETGRVVVTPLYSTAQPLVRYDQGDLAISGTGCSCGRNLPVLESVVGRALAIFTHPDGRSIARIMPESSRETLQCSFWQMVQTGPTDFEVRYVPRDWEQTGDETAFIQEFRKIYFDDATVVLQRLPEIPFTPGGKFLEYLTEWQSR